MNMLVSAGLVRSSRGQHGGFNLARPPGEIKLSQVLQAVEGSIAPTSCVDDPKICNRVDICVTRDIWEKLNKAMLEILDSITLENMIEMQEKKLAKPKAPMYHI
jgi:Rrf2 family protein